MFRTDVVRNERVRVLDARGRAGDRGRAGGGGRTGGGGPGAGVAVAELHVVILTVEQSVQGPQFVYSRSRAGHRGQPWERRYALAVKYVW